MNFKNAAGAICCLMIFVSCKPKVGERSDKLYSRHLQKNVTLKVYNTPPPDNRSDFNLLLLNDPSSFQSIDIKETISRLSKQKMIQPLIIVAIEGKNHFGVAGDGKSAPKDREAEKYSDFIVNELLGYVKKQTGARKFKSVAVAGFGKAGISAMDLGWSRGDKIDAVGVFEPDYDLHNGSFPIFSKISSSRKRPKTSYYFYVPEDAAAGTEPTPTEKISELISNKTKAEIKENNADSSEQEAFTDFLTWAFPP